MTFALNEIEVMGKRAARGAGLPWGLAEEAGKATRWLAGHDLPGPEMLLDILDQNDGKTPGEGAPVSVGEIWRAPSGRLCPLVTGAALCDRAAEISNGREVVCGPILQPLMLAPFLAGAAKLSGAEFELSWDDIVMFIGPRDASLLTHHADPAAGSTEFLCCRRAKKPASEPLKRAARRSVDAATWRRLNDFAVRTFAPATEASRLAGAGAGLTDND